MDRHRYQILGLHSQRKHATLSHNTQHDSQKSSGTPSEHKAERSQVRLLQIVLALVLIYCVAEVIGGIWTGSLALLADAGHMASDAISLVISLTAAWLVTHPPTAKRTFGFHRAEIIAALINGGLLLVVAGGIAVEAVERLYAPVPILGGVMLAIAIGGLLVNLLSLSMLHGHQHTNLNMRGAWLHVMGDTLGSVAVIVAALLIWGFGWNWADPVASVLACLLILSSAWRLTLDALRVLMEEAPSHLSVDDVRRTIEECDGVVNVHCLHAWSIATGLTAASAHVLIQEQENPTEILKRLQTRLSETFPIQHLTLQIERAGETNCPLNDAEGCLPVTTRRPAHDHDHDDGHNHDHSH